MGPRYSNMNAAQYLLAHGAKSLVIASPSTLSAYADGFVPKMAKAAGVPYKIFPTVLPVTDANSQLTSMIQAAGDGGAIILDFTPDTAPAFLQAAIAQGVVDKVMWGSSTPIANTAMAGQFGQFDGKIFINQEFANLDSTGPDETLYNQINAKYSPKIAIQAFGQMGYMDAKFATAALLSVKGAITAKSYNAAVKALVNQKTDMLCKPFYVGNIPYHIPNNCGHHRQLQGRQGLAGRGVQGSPDEHRSADRPDSGLGEEVQADGLAEARRGTSEWDDDQGARGQRCIASSASRCSASTGSCSSRTSCSAWRSAARTPSPGVGIVVLYRATGVLNIAFGAVGAAGALIAY